MHLEWYPIRTACRRMNDRTPFEIKGALFRSLNTLRNILSEVIFHISSQYFSVIIRTFHFNMVYVISLSYLVTMLYGVYIYTCIFILIISSGGSRLIRGSGG